VHNANVLDEKRNLTQQCEQFFGQSEGCLDRNCPFLHDREATLFDRAEVLEKRRKTFDPKYRPNFRQVTTRQCLMVDLLSGGNEDLKDAMLESEQLDEDAYEHKAYCANIRCMMPWKKGETNPLKACTGCVFTLYCSVRWLPTLYT
jgi:hypothetical protein